MNKIKPIVVCSFFLVFILIGLTVFKIKQQEEFKQKTALAQDTNKAMVHLMFDLSKAHESTIQGVPADGLWYNSVAFLQKGQGELEYFTKEGRLFRIDHGGRALITDHIVSFHLRRQKQTPGILEVQIEARKNVSLAVNLKIRIRH